MTPDPYTRYAALPDRERAYVAYSTLKRLNRIEPGMKARELTYGEAEKIHDEDWPQ